MKIGLVSYYSRNYGALLQGYALQEVLRGLGHEVVAINRGFGAYGNLVWNFHYTISQRVKKALVNFPFDDFVKNELNMSSPVLSEEDLARLGQSFDVIISGSDQIWNVDTLEYMQYYFFLDWVGKGTRKYSYAASFGKDTFNSTNAEKNKVGKLLSEYKAISVRESSGTKICRDEFGLMALQHLDPTLLLTADKYLRLLKDKKRVSSPYLCTYILDVSSTKQIFIDTVKKIFCLDRVDNYAQSERFKEQLRHKSHRMPTVYQWLSNIANANMVITDSFHGTVFSIIFHKPFLCINNKKRGTARFESLLGSVGLLDRLVDLEKVNIDKAMMLLNQKINFDEVERRLDLLRTNSLNFLKSI